MSERLRLFIGAALSEEAQAVCASADGWIESLGSFRLVPARQRHVTIAFIGDVDREDVGRVSDAVREVCAATGAFDAEFLGLTALPSALRARVLAAALDGKSGLASLMAGVTSALIRVAPTEALERAQGRGALAHVTLARLGGGRRPRRVDLKGGPALSGRLAVVSLEVVRSTLTPAGPIHEVMDRHALGGGSVAD